MTVDNVKRALEHNNLDSLIEDRCRTKYSYADEGYVINPYDIVTVMGNLMKKLNDKGILSAEDIDEVING